MPNRYTRDQLIVKAIDMIQSGNLQHHDCPDGVVQPDAYAVGWLQDILDFWYHIFPFGNTITKATLNCTSGSDSITLPSDFILDVRDGYVVQQNPNDNNSYIRLRRVTLPQFLNRQLSQQGSTNVDHPWFYTILGRTIKVTPTPNIATNGQLWYYQLPPILESNDIPTFPSDYALIEYIRVRGLEWIRAYEPGTAQKFCDKIVSSMKANGMLNEPEDDEVIFDGLTHVKRMNPIGSYNWMGAR